MTDIKEELSLINKYTRKKLTENDVYTFSVILCDNDVDRDYEAFTAEALGELAHMFLGKTGIFDHNAKAAGQSARVYKTWTETDNTKKVPSGEFYCCLKAKAYMVKTDSNKSLIDEIEGGIKKEVSVSCRMDSSRCSICGKEFNTDNCRHRKGRIYGGKLCYGILSQPGDAYEWSFVAVPAQRKAGVTKSFYKEKNMNSALDVIKSAAEGIELSYDEVKSLRVHIEELEAFRADAEEYRTSLKSDIQKYALIVMPCAAGSEEFLSGCDNMSIKQLKSIKNGLEKQAHQIIPPTVQLQSKRSMNTADNKAYTI